VKVVNLGYSIEESHGKDITDWKGENHSKEEFEELVRQAPLAENPKRQTLPVKRLADILEYPEPEWLIEGLIVENTLCLLSAYSGVGKSVLTLTIARSICDGFPLFGEFKVNRTGPVLIVDEETPQAFLKDRVLKIGFRPDDPVAFLHFAGVRLDDPKAFDLLMATIEEEKPILVVIDPLIRCHTRKENDSSEMRDVMANLRKLANTPTTVIVVHHFNKGNAPMAERSRGSSDITAGVDVEYALLPKGDLLEMSMVKTRIKPMPSILLRNEDLMLRYAGRTHSAREEIILEIGKALTDGPKRIGEVKDWLEDQDVTVSLPELREIMKAGPWTVTTGAHNAKTFSF
jgi:hypothetical protein